MPFKIHDSAQHIRNQESENGVKTGGNSANECEPRLRGAKHGQKVSQNQNPSLLQGENVEVHSVGVWSRNGGVIE